MGYVLQIPVVGLQAPKTIGSRQTVKNTLKNIIDNYGKYIKVASEESNIPAPVITAFIGVESGGDALASASGRGTCHATIGLMQWNRQYTKATLEKEFSTGRLSDVEKGILAKYGIKFDKNGKTRAINCNDQKQPELNILIGTIILGQIISEIASKSKGWAVEDNDVLRLDKVISVYNGGAFSTAGKMAQTSTLRGVPVDTTSVKKFRDLVATFNPTTKKYVDVIMGKDGFLDVLTSELKNETYG
jgi:soluble lytic murein transglycosylase-like protein